MKDRVQVLEERIDKLTKKVCLLEQGGEERGSSSSEDECGRMEMGERWLVVQGSSWVECEDDCLDEGERDTSYCGGECVGRRQLQFFEQGWYSLDQCWPEPPGTGQGRTNLSTRAGREPWEPGYGVRGHIQPGVFM